VARWSFDERSGRNVPDLSGNAFWAVPTGEIDFEPSLSGEAPRFDGSAYYVIAAGEALEFPRITISAWIMPDTITGRWGVVAKRNRGTTCPYVLAIRQGGVTFQGTDVTGEWSYIFTTKPVVEGGRWNHIVAVCEDGIGARLYCNGRLVGEKAASEKLVSTGNAPTIGHENWGGVETKAGASGNFRGLIDEVAIWSRVLTDEEIAAEYERLREGAEADLQRREEEAAAREAPKQRLATEIVAGGGVDWRPIVADDFEREALGPDWLTLRGAWEIVDGTLRCSETSFLAYAEKLAAPVRIEFDARSDRPGDLTAFWGTEDAGYRDGYFIGFASNGNTACKLLRLGREVLVQDGPLATPGRWHHVIGQVLPDRLQLIVDGEPAMEYEEPEPLEGRRLPGIIAWSEGEFDNLRIYTAP